MKRRASLAFVAGCVGAVLAYSLIRLAQRLLLTEPDPALVFTSEHAGFFWRAWTAAYVGGTCAFLGWLAAARNADRVATFLSRAVVAAFGIALLQGILVP